MQKRLEAGLVIEDRIAALMIDEARSRRRMHGLIDYDKDDTNELSDEDDYNHRRQIRRYSMPPVEINEESSNPRRPVSRLHNSLSLYLLSFIIILLILNVFICNITSSTLLPCGDVKFL